MYQIYLYSEFLVQMFSSVVTSLVVPALVERAFCKCGALDLLFHQLIYDRYAQKRYFDFGISTEHGGQMLNEGLLFQKEGFGGRAVVYDTYEMEV